MPGNNFSITLQRNGWKCCISALQQKAEGKPIIGPMIIDKAKFFYNEMTVTDKCKLSEGWL